MDTARNYIRFELLSDIPDKIPGRIPFNDSSFYAMLLLRSSTSSNLSFAFANLSIPSGVFVTDFLQHSLKGSPVYLMLLELEDRVPRHIKNYYGSLQNRTIDFDINQSSVVSRLIKKMLRWHGNTENKTLENLYFKMLLQYITEIGQQTINYKSRQEEINDSFLKLLHSDNYPNHGVRHYANMLFVTRPYLTRAVRTVTGSTPKVLIDQKIAGVAKLLLESHESINVISDKLGFDSVSTFTTFFKKQEGLSPLSYRKSRNQN